MDAQPLNKASKLPLLITGGASATPATLAAWASANRTQLDAWLHRSGGVLFRGFGIQSIAEFRDLAVAARPELAAYIGGDSPRNRVADKIYTSTEFPPQV